jgi:nucleoside-diphosphate-sugar epimerase
MRVFVAGATGAIGKQLVPRLVAAGHEVHGMTHSESKQAMLYKLGAEPVLADREEGGGRGWDLSSRGCGRVQRRNLGECARYRDALPPYDR